MAQIDELLAGIEAVNTKLGELSDSFTDFTADFHAAVEKLQADIAAGGVDLGPALSGLSALLAKADSITESVKALDSEAEGISGKPTPPTA